MKKQLYIALSKRLLKEVPELKYVARYRGQPNDAEKARVFARPAVFVQFGRIDWRRELQGIQEGDCDLLLHVVYDSWSDSFRQKKAGSDDGAAASSQEKDLAEFDVLEKIHQALEGWSGESWVGLTRVAEDLDTEVDHLVVELVSYRTRLRDASAWTLRNDDETEDVAVEVAVEVVPEKPDEWPTVDY